MFALDLDRHRMPQIVQARPAGGGDVAQAEPSGQPSEGPIQNRRDNPAARHQYEEGIDLPAGQMRITLCPIGFQCNSGRLMHGDETGFTELGVADGDDALVEIDVIEIEVQDFAHAHPGHADEAVNRITPQAI